jgi:hypothetical protein
MEEALLPRNACVFVTEGPRLTSRYLGSGQMHHIIIHRYTEIYENFCSHRHRYQMIGVDEKWHLFKGVLIYY